MTSIHGSGLGDKARLLSVLTVLLLAGFSGTSFFAYMAARDSIRANIERNDLPVAAETVYARLQKDLVEPIFVSSMMANDTFLHDWVKSGEKDLAAIRRYLSEIKGRYGAFTSFFVSERTGRYYYPDGILKTVDSREPRDAWYFRVRRMSDPYELNVDPDLANRDALTIFINYRMINTDGTFLGAAGVGLAVESMIRMVATLRKEYGTAVYFVDRNGIFVASGDPSRASGKSALEDADLGPVAREAISSGKSTFRYRSQGGNILLFVRWLPEVKWYLFVERNETEAIAGARRALYLNLAVYALIFILAQMAVTLTVNRYQTRLERTASYDPLTSAMNRLAFQNVADHALREARRNKKPISVALFDADHFKNINDSRGHAEGDRVLTLIVSAGMAALRGSDLLCRWGGEEFLALLPGTDPEGAREAAEKLREAVRKATESEDGRAVTLSAGTATLLPGEDLETLVRRADDALLEAKKLGRDRVVIAR